MRIGGLPLTGDPYSEAETYARGGGKIDYILVTPKTQMCVKYVHIAPYNKWILSDHHALIIDIDYQSLDKRGASPLAETG